MFQNSAPMDDAHIAAPPARWRRDFEKGRLHWDPQLTEYVIWDDGDEPKWIEVWMACGFDTRGQRLELDPEELEGVRQARAMQLRIRGGFPAPEDVEIDGWSRGERFSTAFLDKPALR